MNDPLTEQVIGAAFNVHNTLGFGFLESVYEKALSIELTKLGIDHTTQAPIRVTYDGQNVGDFVADMLVNDRLIVELKSVTQLTTAHEVQLVNYLTATGIESGLLINFGPTKVEVRRKFRTYRKQYRQGQQDCTGPVECARPPFHRTVLIMFILSKNQLLLARRFVCSCTAVVAVARTNAVSLDIELSYSVGIENHPSAVAAIQQAAAMWEQALSDPVTIKMDVREATVFELGFGVQGAAFPTWYEKRYSLIRDALVADASSPDDAVAVAHLQPGPQMRF